MEEDLYESLSSYSIARGAESVTQTMRELLYEILQEKASKAFVPKIRSQLSEEFDSFFTRLETKLAFVAEDVLTSLEDRVSWSLDDSARTANAALAAACMAAANTGSCGGNAEDVRSAAFCETVPDALYDVEEDD